MGSVGFGWVRFILFHTANKVHYMKATNRVLKLRSAQARVCGISTRKAGGKKPPKRTADADKVYTPGLGKRARSAYRARRGTCKNVDIHGVSDRFFMVRQPGG